MKGSRLGALVVLLTAALTAPGQAQEQTCQQVLPSDFRRIINETGEEVMYFRDPVRMICSGGVQIEADSAVMNRSTSTLEMVGRVLYRDGERQLTSDWAHYLGESDELFAMGTVILTDMANGSVISGDDFEFRRQTEERPESHMIMRGQRPHAALRRETAEGGEPGAPVLVWADRLELIGETLFLADRNVELEREGLKGSADAARFDQAAERMTLTGSAQVETEEYHLEGDRIDAFMTGDLLRDVVSEGAARLEAEDVTIRGHTIRIGFVDGQPERVEAWNPRTLAVDDEGEEDEADTNAGVPRAQAISQDFRLRADSIDARSLNGRLREVRAVGRAFGEREADAQSSHLPDLIARDWIQGDTITGYFAEPDPETPVEVAGVEEARDSRNDVVLERIEVIGGSSDALSLYRTDAPDGGGRPAVNFMRARKITLFMSEGEVGRVEADGPLEGVYMDPAGTAREAPPETTEASARRSS